MSSQPHSQEICKYGSLTYYGYCGLGGVLSCGITHTAIVPLDLVKCRIQVDPAKYKNIGTGFRVTLANEGIRGLGLGWAPTFFGYSMQGLGKFGFYEVFKHVYSGMLDEENAYIYRSLVYGLASASAEFFADIMLSPMEALKVRMQTQPGWCRTLREGLPRMMREEGLYGFYKSIVPLWSRQIPYTVMKFVSFEAILKTLYDSWPRPRDECSFPEQLTLTFSAGYLAGVLCAIVSHPADTLVSKLNKDPDARLGDLVKRLGFFGLWGGLGPRIIMIGTLTGLQWFIYDGFKVAVGLPRPPPLQMPESLRLKLEQKDD